VESVSPARYSCALVAAHNPALASRKYSLKIILPIGMSSSGGYLPGQGGRGVANNAEPSAEVTAGPPDAAVDHLEDPSPSTQSEENKQSSRGGKDLGTPASQVTKKKKKKKDRFYKRFTYQQLRGYRPILTASLAMVFFAVAGSIQLGIGIPILLASIDVVQYRVRYDNAGTLANFTSEERAMLVTSDDGVQYSMDIFVDKEMKGPVYVTFELGTFYQNYRRYVRSYDSQQMHDGDIFPGASSCEPFLYETASGLDPNASLPEQGAILPCGQISHSNFNDSFELSSNIPSLDVTIDDSNIAWTSDKTHLYGNISAVNYNLIPEYRGGSTSLVPLNEDEHWMVWQRPAAHKQANKLYGMINSDIPQGTTLTLTIFNRYNTYTFDGTKTVMLSTNSWMGGKNYVLPYIYIANGGLCYLILAVFVLSRMGSCFGLRREPGDLRHLSWNSNKRTGKHRAIVASS
jgi:hypothetical protein